jgi:hypothetical protein
MPRRYRSPGMRFVEAENVREAAAILAGRIARRDYPDNGFCRKLRCLRQDLTCFTFEATIGHLHEGHLSPKAMLKYADRKIEFIIYRAARLASTNVLPGPRIGALEQDGGKIIRRVGERGSGQSLGTKPPG